MKNDFCEKQPTVRGICCRDAERLCRFCGWNPEEAARRRKETLEKLKEKEQDK